MNTKDKLVERFKRQLKDFTWEELARLLEYKGYYGTVEYSGEDGCLFGRVAGMPYFLIRYEGNTASELYADFKDAMDTCPEALSKKMNTYNI